MPVIQESLSLLRTHIRQHTHADEAVCVERLLAESKLTRTRREHILNRGRTLVTGCREDSDKAGILDVFTQEYSLSSKEGVAMMCLAESLLRIPDAETADDLIAEKILSGDWGQHRGQSESLFVNASTWGLMLTGHVVSLESEITEHTASWLKQLINRLGEPVVRGAVRQSMKIMGQQYVLGRDIAEAIRRGNRENTKGTRFSFDMLGEGARTREDASRYYEAYLQAIRGIGGRAVQDNVIEANGISVKFSALHPRYQYAQKDRVLNEMLPRVRVLAMEAKTLGLGFTIDAEEAERLDLSLDLLESLARDPELTGWDGLGFVLQAYSKRSPFVAKWLVALAQDTGRKLMVRLVKGAYWDSEIKFAQEEGYSDYPVYTRKANTDLCYQVCATILLDAQDAIYPQFATHNAYTVALVLELAEGRQFEFQRLHGMGDLLHMQLSKGVGGQRSAPVRVYAPVGAHKDLLPYLVRRLLENGANSSFVNRFLNKKVPVSKVITDLRAEVESSVERRHTAIPLPVDIFRIAGEDRPNTRGVDLANVDTVQALMSKVASTIGQPRAIGPIIGGAMNASEGELVVCPADTGIVVGSCRKASAKDVHRALDLATGAQRAWNGLGGVARAEILERAAAVIEAQIYELTGLIACEAGRTLNDGISEVREAVDFLRYYALQARMHFGEAGRIDTPLGEVGEHSLDGRGLFFCISPWNFPLAIFVGQVAAALAAGNSVIAKPSDLAPHVAAEAIKILHAAGVPGDVLHFMPGSGKMLGDILNADPRTSGVAFTGSTEVAQDIDKTLAERAGDPPVLIAETGGQNAMIVDSSSLPEQVVDDVVRSAFSSAGQRCSALRVIYVQDEIFDTTIKMLKGAMQELAIGCPWQLSTDVGPVIDKSAQRTLLQHIENMKRESHLHYACDLPEDCQPGTFVAPHLFELQSVNQLPGEIFGPVLHVIRFTRANFKLVINEINSTGFGLTLGVHSRIEKFADHVVKLTSVGNNYINRNMVGAVVGVNPFGGQGLSGTGPKAGGPHYITGFAREKITVHNPIDKVHSQKVGSNGGANAIIGGKVCPQMNDEKIDEALMMADRYQADWNLKGGNYRSIILDEMAALIEKRMPPCAATAKLCRYYAEQARKKYATPIRLNGPTGEVNELSLNGRGLFFCAVAENETSIAAFVEQVVAALAAGNSVIAKPSGANVALASAMIQALLDSGIPKEVLHFIPDGRLGEIMTSDSRTAGVAWRGSMEDAAQLKLELIRRGGPIVPVIVEAGGPNYLLSFGVEKTKTTNIVATGGNTQLLNLGEG